MAVVKELVKRGAKVNTHMKVWHHKERISRNYKPWLISLVQKTKKKDTKEIDLVIFKSLVLYGKSLFLKKHVNCFFFQDRATPLFIAAQNGHLQVLLFLLSQGAEPDPRRTDGATPLWIASQMGHHQIVRELLIHGARVDSTRHVSFFKIF